MKPFARKKPVQLPLQDAEQMLSSIFSLCQKNPNTVPLESLCAYSSYRKERFALLRTIIAVILVLFLLLPLLFLFPRIQLEQINAGRDENPVYELNIAPAVPLRRIEARMDGRSVPVYEISDRRFRLQPIADGRLEISATFVNGQQSTASAEVSGVDMDAPRLLSTEAKAGVIRLYVSDEGSGVDYAGAAFVNPEIEAPSLSFDAEDGCILVPYPSAPLDLRIPDQRGNALVVRLTPEK